VKFLREKILNYLINNWIRTRFYVAHDELNLMTTTRLALVSATATAAAALIWLVIVSRRREKGKKGNEARQGARILVTGFNDWRNLQGPEDAWRSRENPSSRLLLGGECETPPIHKDGPLVRYLQDTSDIAREADWQFSFITLPTVWKAAWAIDHCFYDVVVNIGLGVYDNTNTILVEDGAVNLRKAIPDARGNLPASVALAKGSPDILEATPSQKRAATTVDNTVVGGFNVQVIRARSANSYICNETHWRGLEAVRLADKLKASYFIHVPHPEVEGQYGNLASAVGQIIERLVGEVLLPPGSTAIRGKSKSNVGVGRH
jgi:pyrrolidone-carboxylate peptidase